MIPAIIAVMIPFSGETPEAMAKAIANGSATIPIIRPERRSFMRVSLEMPCFKRENSLGVNSFLIVYLNILQCLICEAWILQAERVPVAITSYIILPAFCYSFIFSLLIKDLSG